MSFVHTASLLPWSVVGGGASITETVHIPAMPHKRALQSHFTTYVVNRWLLGLDEAASVLASDLSVLVNSDGSTDV